jgi:hypothetical protein
MPCNFALMKSAMPLHVFAIQHTTFPNIPSMESLFLKDTPQNHNLLKYAVSLDDLEFLLFLSPEKVFNKKRLKLAEVGMSWDPKRLDSMIRRGLIGQLREKPTALYTLTPHARHIINSVYRKLEGKEPINTSPRSNPLYAPKAPFSYKLYRRQAEDLNESIIRQRRRAQESQGTDGPQSST